MFSEKSCFFHFGGTSLIYHAIICVILFGPKTTFMKTCLLAFGSGVFFFFLILQSAWWVVPCVITWGAILYWQDRQERRRQAAADFPGQEPDKPKR